jgi:HEAT repeat protein
MGQLKADQAIALEPPTIRQFLNLCTEQDISIFPAADQWGLQLLEAGDFQERWRIAKVLPKLGNTIIEPLLKLAENPHQDTELRWFAIRVLGQYQKPEVVTRLVLLLDSCHEEFLADEIMRALLALEERAISYILPLLDQLETRYLAVQALSRLRYPDVVEPLLEVTQDPDPRIRVLAIETLSSFRHYRIFEKLVAALVDPVSEVRLQGIKALGFWANYADKNIIFQQVTPLLYDHNLEVCRQAALTLSRLQTADAAGAIAKVIEKSTTPYSLKIEFVQALAWINDPSSLDLLAQILSNASEDLIQAILKAIGRISETERQLHGAQVLLQFWQRQTVMPMPAIRQHFVYALGHLHQSAAQDIQNILEQLSGDEDEGVRLHAIAALRRPLRD